MMREYGVVHARATPATGKTTLSKLLATWLASTGNRVVYIDNWEVDNDAQAFLVEKCHRLGFYEVGEMIFLSSDNCSTFIIDEAQSTYDNSHLWYAVIKYRIGTWSPILLVQFLRESTDCPQTITPPVLCNTQRDSLLPINRIKQSISLFYDMQEFGNVVRRFCQDSVIEFTLTNELQHYIFQ